MMRLEISGRPRVGHPYDVDPITRPSPKRLLGFMPISVDPAMTSLTKNGVLIAILALVGMLMLLLPGPALAKKGDNSNWCTTTVPATLPQTVNQTDLSVLRDLPIGSPIPNTHVDIHLTMQCKTGAFDTTTNIVIFDLYVGTALTSVPGLSNVYTTGTLPGIGLRMLDSAGRPMPIESITVDGCTHLQAVLLGTGTNSTTTMTFNGALELVKIADTVATGSQTIQFQPGVCGQVWGNNNSSDSLWKIVSSISRPSVTTCTVANKDISVAMPVISGSTLPSIGSTAAATPFKIELTCNAGATLFMTLTDASTPSNTSDKLTATADSTATGVALQIFREDGTTVSYGPDSSLPGTTNQHLIGATTDGIQLIPFTAKYIRAGAVTAGSLNGKATFTLSYQ